ncbi:hypothetical protein F383_33540 [Gossypium arboreum]|uniref:Uncharacterized protein n=1 Tax=Gossypium arboreum TaxID=29729 RepID=A0A0B0MWY4_GOSAR|nr:hypothetical protein F383_33540 [Gossypium arboreum]
MCCRKDLDRTGNPLISL